VIARRARTAGALLAGALCLSGLAAPPVSATAATPVASNDAPGGTATVKYGDPVPDVTVSASDDDSFGDALTATAEGLPDGMTLEPDSNSGGSTLPGTATWNLAGGAVSAAPGSYHVTATVTDPDDATGATEFDVVVEQADQAITFDPTPAHVFGDPDFAVSATSSSGLPVSFTAVGGCTVSGSQVTITAAHSCTVSAHQPGDANYAAAPDVEHKFRVEKRPTTTKLKLKHHPVKRGRRVRMKATVSSDGIVPSGVMRFSGGKLLDIVEVGPDGVVKFSFKAPHKRRTYTLHAVFTDNDENFASSEDTARLTVH
jgi:hypothetical protein